MANTRPRWKRRILGSFLFLCLLVVAAVGGGFFYLTNHDTNMEWLRAKIESTINERADGILSVKLASARLSLDDQGEARLRLRGLMLQTKDQRLLVSGDVITIQPNWLSLLSDQVEIRSVSILDGSVVAGPFEPIKISDTGVDELTLMEISKITKGDQKSNVDHLITSLEQIQEIAETAKFDNEEQKESDAEILSVAAEILENAGMVFDQVHLFKLGIVQVNNIALTIVGNDGAVERSLDITSANFTEVAVDDGGRAKQKIEIKTRQRGADGVQIILSHIKDDASSKRAFLFDVSNVIARNFFERLNWPDYPIDIGIQVALRGTMVLLEEKIIDQFDLTLDAGEGYITTGPKSTFPVSSGLLHLSLNRREHSLVVHPSPFVFDKNTVTTQGEIILPGRLSDPYLFDLVAYDSYFDSGDVNEQPVMVEEITARGALQPREKLISVSDFDLNAGDVEFSASVSFGFDGKTPSMALAAAIGRTPLPVLKQLWPIFIAPTARGWTIKNVYGGLIEGGTISSAIPTGVLGRLRKGKTLKPNELQYDFQMTETSFNTFGDFPSVDQAVLTGTGRGISFTVDLKKGLAKSDFDSTVSVENGRFHVADVRFPGPTASISFNATGKSSDIAAISDKSPVKALGYADLKAEGLSGEISADVDLTVPLRSGLKPDDVEWKAALELRGFSSSEPVDGRTIQKANAKVQINRDLLTIVGEGLIDGILANVDLQRPLTSAGANQTFAIQAILSDKDRKKLGIDFGDYLKGPISVAIDKKQGSGNDGEAYVVDLSKAEIELDFIGWRKAKGVKATAEMQIIAGKDVTRVRNFVLKGDGFGGAGSVDLSPEGEIRNLNLSRLALRNSDKISVRAKLLSERVYDISIEGSSFDARSLIKVLTVSANEPAEQTYRYKIRTSISEVTGYLNEVIRDLDLEVNLRGSTVLRLAAQGLTNGAAQPFIFSYGSQANRGDVLNARGSDGGALARFANIYYRAFGGPFTLNGVREAGAKAMNGLFRMKNFRLIDEPALKGLSGSKDSSGRSSVKFNALNIDFVEEDQRLTVTKGLLSGDNVGGTYEGVLNRKTKAIDFTGTYVPAYVINNFISKIPIVGLALGNGQREGLIGVTFKVGGTLGKPRVSVNPLSALAPGFLRQLFRFKKAQGQTN